MVASAMYLFEEKIPQKNAELTTDNFSILLMYKKRTSFFNLTINISIGSHIVMCQNCQKPLCGPFCHIWPIFLKLNNISLKYA